MELLKRRIKVSGTIIGNDVLKVDSFLNHQIDPFLMKDIAEEFVRRFSGSTITKILTIESSGIAPAILVGQILSIPVVCAKKKSSLNQDPDSYTAKVYSYTKEEHCTIHISRNVLCATDSVLIIDDFLANGQAISGLCEIITQAGAQLVGAGVIIEKGFQKGGLMLRNMGIRVESLATIETLSKNRITFKNEEDEQS
jgi:xanthine phosphoribosyltransferase